MIQLKVYDTEGNQHWLDLYETEPIKLNLSVEDITDAEARSIFSRTFRVPSTSNNNRFFKNAFLVEGVDYDVTQKKAAEILVDGAEFRVGHIRLQKIFKNKDTDRIDYEIVFFGETRDFASSVGQGTLADIDTSDITHVLDSGNVIQSWGAYPQTGDLSGGLFDGDVLYPLVDFGNEYHEHNNLQVPTQPRIAYGPAATTQTDGYNFNHSNNPIQATRFKPMLRTKYLIDKIFDNAGFEYESQFLNSNLFRTLYTSAWGNEASIGVPNVSNQNTLSVQSSFSQSLSFQSGPLPNSQKILFTNEISDPGNNWFNDTYNIPANGDYEFDITILGEHDVLNGVTVGLAYKTPTGSYQFLQQTEQVFTNFNFAYTYTGTIQNLIAGGEIALVIQANSTNIGFPNRVFTGAQFKILSAPGEFTPSSLLDNTYKQIDFIKDILTTFRLVMSPSRTNPKKFIIEPWNDYIMSGDLYDWSHKLVEEKDLVVEPLFFSQSDRVEYRNAEDLDHLNGFNIRQFKETFGGLNFDANNELLKGTRNVKVNWAPTPITQIIGYDPADYGNFLIPQIHTIEEEGGFNIHEPIKPKTRLLFYNGRVTQTGTPSNGMLDWYMETGQTVTGWSNYPRVSHWSDAIPDANTINLNWQIERGYWNTFNENGIPWNGQNGRGLFDSYWGDYTTSIYDKDARKVTAYFILNNVDLNTFSFDDVIFVNGVYYRPSKIIDAQIGKRSPVKVELIKLLNYQPTFVIYGCTDPSASNYNPMANIDDGSCQIAIPGCTDPSALNYDPNATVDDGSCSYPPPVVLGCTDPAASNYNPNANQDDGSCIYPVPGCTDPNANNYNPNATVDDGSCTYDPGPISGCTNTDAVNYNPNATVDDGSCYFLPIDGAQDPEFSSTPLCSNTNGTTLDPAWSGGDQPYTVQVYGNGVLITTHNNVPAGVRTSTQFSGGTIRYDITDQLGTMVSHTYTLSNPIDPIVPAFNTTTNSIEVLATGGTGSIRVIQWDGATVNHTLPHTFTNLTSSTSYTWTLIDDNGCEVNGSTNTDTPPSTTLRNEEVIIDQPNNRVRLVWQGSQNASYANQIINFLNGNQGATQGVTYFFQYPKMGIEFQTGPNSGLYQYNTGGLASMEWFFDGIQVVVDLNNITPTGGSSLPSNTYPWSTNLPRYSKFN